MDLKFLQFLVIFVPIVLATRPASYKNHKVVEFTIENERQLKAAKELEHFEGYKYWDYPSKTNTEVELVIKPEIFPDFVDMADKNGIKYQILTEDVETWFNLERPVSDAKADEPFALDRYNSYDQILNFLDKMSKDFPSSASVFTMGYTFENRSLNGIRISKNIENPAIFIEANIHAREWITSATAVWLINEFLTSQNVTVRDFVDNITWYIVPVTNPDGYEYSYTTERLWRKTRSNFGSILCFGADPNRNFGYNWMQSTGASSLPCNNVFAGVKPFSEPETKALDDFYSKISEKVKIYLSFHSAARVLLYPWGHTMTPASNYNDLKSVAEATVKALTERHGTVYKFGSSIEAMYPAPGVSVDHFYGSYGTKLAYTYEMRVGSTGWGFVLPPEQIAPNSEEVFESLMAMVAKAKELGYFD